MIKQWLIKLVFPAAMAIAVAIPLWIAEELPAKLPPPKPIAPPALPGALERAQTALETSREALDQLQRIPVDEDTTVLDAALRRIFKSARPPATEASILEILRYIPQVTALQFLNSGRGSDCLAKAQGLGDGMALAFTMLCRRIGFPARINTLHNFEFMQGHTGVEVYYDGAWHFFDSTYAAFFYTEPEYNAKGRIPALREVMTDPALRQNAFMVSDPAALWKGVHLPDAGIRPFARDFAYGDYKFNLGQLYDQVFSKSFPVSWSPDATASFPVDVDLTQQDERWIGQPDADVLDMAGKQPDGRYPRFFGAVNIGPGRLGGAAHLLTLNVRTPGLYRITYHVTPDSPLDALAVVEIKNALVARTATQENTWTIEAYLQDNPGMLLITSPGQSVHIDAIHITRATP